MNYTEFFKQYQGAPCNKMGGMKDNYIFFIYQDLSYDGAGLVKKNIFYRYAITKFHKGLQNEMQNNF